MSPLSQQGSPYSRVFEQERADACLAQSAVLPTLKRPNKKIIGPEAGEAKAAWAGRRKGKQDANQKGRVHISGH